MLAGLTALLGGGAGGGGSFESIATAVGNGSSGVITFSSIPSTYKHLQVRVLGRSGTATNPTTYFLRFNADGGSNYAYHELKGDGSTASASGTASTSTARVGIIPSAGASANIMGTSIIDIHDYTSKTKNKTTRVFSAEDRNGAGNIYLTSSLWMNTAAINELTLHTASNWTTTTVISLYGIRG